MLPDERLDDGKGLSATRSADHPSSPERVADVHPSLAELSLVIVAHGHVDRILVLYQLRALLETFVFQIETVFQQAFFQELGDIIECHMDKDSTHYGCRHIEDDIQT